MGESPRSAVSSEPTDGSRTLATSMELFDTTQIGLERALTGASLRQEAIASNIANVNTPGYRRQDVDFQSALQAAWGQGKDAASRGHPGGRHRPVAPRSAQTAARSTSTSRPPRRPRTACSTRRSPRSSRPASSSSAPRSASADGPLRRHRRRRLRPLGRAPAHGRHVREPRQRADDQGRRRPALPAQGRRARRGRRRGLVRQRAQRGDGPRRGQRVEPGARRAGRRHRPGLHRRSSASTTRAIPTPTPTAT